MTELLALLPILILTLCMVGLGWSAASAGMAGAAMAILVAVVTFDYATDLIALAGPLLEAGITAATILWIIFPALALHELQTSTGAAARMSLSLASITNEPIARLLILAWFMALLMEGAAGFGTPVALIAPMLVGIGYPPAKALLLALVGHAAGVSFGAVGTPVMALLELSPQDPHQISLAIMVLHLAFGWTLVRVLSHVGGYRLSKKNWLIPPLAALCFFLPATLLAWLTGPELPTLGGAMLGGAIFIGIVKWLWRAEEADNMRTQDGLVRALLPYILILVAMLATRIIPTFAVSLQSFVLEWEIAGRFGGLAKPLYHPGTLLMLALACVALVQKDSRAHMLPAFGKAARRLPSVALALVSVLFLSGIMVHSGMIATLSVYAAGIFGDIWPMAVPFIGALGSFITGSATASNILFGNFQLTAAETVGLAPLLALAGQGFGAGIGNIIAPHNIVAGAATVGLIGREGAVLKSTLPICLGYAAAGGLLLLALA
jgi:lactate permease